MQALFESPKRLEAYSGVRFIAFLDHSENICRLHGTTTDFGLGTRRGGEDMSAAWGLISVALVMTVYLSCKKLFQQSQRGLVKGLDQEPFLSDRQLMLSTYAIDSRVGSMCIILFCTLFRLVFA